MIRAMGIEHKSELEMIIPFYMEGKLRQAEEKSSGRCRDILKKFLQKTRAIPSVSNDVV